MSTLKPSPVLSGMHAWLAEMGDKEPVGISSPSADAQMTTTQDSPLNDSRRQMFIAKGVSKDDAQVLAMRLFERDERWDDRRSCAECTNFEYGHCLVRRQPFGGGGIEVLHRCQGFSAVAS